MNGKMQRAIFGGAVAKASSRPSGAGTQPEAEGFMARIKEFWGGCEK